MLLQGLFPIMVNVGEEVFRSNIRSSIERDLPWLQQSEAHEGMAVIVAGGPSLADLNIQTLQGHTVIAVNNTAGWLMERGVTPDYHVLLDARKISHFIHKNPKTTYLIASQCSPETFDAAGQTILWHPNIEGIKEFIGDRETALIGGGTTVGLQAMSIAYTLGFRKIHLVGFDSSYRGTEGHAYAQPENDGEPLVRVQFANREFMCARWMIHQVEEFKGVLKQLVDLDCVVTVAGDGYLQATVREMLKTTLTAVYDLAVSPPTYDFISFLCEAEKARIEGGHTYLDMVFMPGPKDGFRDDNLPPDLASRQGMLHRICVSACRLLPSIRNVTIRKDRQEVACDFPKNWTVLTPVNHYGTRYFKDAQRPLRATESAKRAVKRDKPYVTITLRQSSYWPQRNSNLEQWQKAAEQITAMGYEIVWLEDTEVSNDVRSWDIDLRLALYEGAYCNLGVSNGPCVLFFYSESPYLLFKILVESAPSASTAFLAANGVFVGDQYGPNGRLVWDDDTAEVIVRAFKNIDIPDQQPNTPREIMLSQVEQNLKRDLPMFIEKDEHSNTALIVGGGPSLKNELPVLRKHYERGGHVFATNGTHDWLIERGIIPEFHVMVDARAENAAFVKNPHKDVTYLIGAQCHADVFKALEGHSVVMWVAPIGGIEPLMEDCNKPVIIVRGGSTVGMSAIQLAKLWGYRRIRLFGMDSCYNGTHHAYPQPLNDGETVLDVEYGGKKFRCALWMAKQAEHFEAELPKLIEDGVHLHIHGEGLLSHMKGMYGS